MDTTKALTPTQRARKVATARRRMEEARALLGEVCSDYEKQGFRLTYAESTQWSEVAAAATAAERALDTLPTA